MTAPILPRERVHALVDRALDSLRTPDRGRPSLERAHVREARDLALYAESASALVIGAALLAEERDPRAAALVTATFAYTDGYDDQLGPDDRAFARALEMLVTLAGERAVDEARKLALPGKTRVPVEGRLAIVIGLAHHVDRSERVRELLHAMHADDDDRVRGEVRAALGGHAPPPWWGLFGRDPLAAFSPDEARRLRKHLDRALQISALESYEWGKEMPALRRAVAALPDDVALPILMRLFLRPRFFDRALARRLFAGTWPRAAESTDPTPLERVVRARPNDPFDLPAGIAQALRRLDREVRAAMALRLFDALVRGGATPQFDFAALAVALYPPDADPRPIFERIAGCPAEEAGARGREVAMHVGDARWAFGRWLERASSLGTLLGPAIDALERDFPRTYKPFAEVLERILVRSREPAVRNAAERALASGSDRLGTFALRHLSGTGRVKGRDAPSRALLTSAVRSPRLRALIAKDASLGALALPALREALAKGTLDPREITNVLALLTKQKLEPANDEREVVRRALETLSGREPLPPELAPLLGAALRAEIVAVDHEGVTALRSAWKKGGPRAELYAQGLVRALVGGAPPAAWRTLVREIAERGPGSSPELARLVIEARFGGEEERDP